MQDDHHRKLTDLYDALLLLESRQEAEIFFRDLCTPREIHDMEERWKVCQVLSHDKFSYREVQEMTGASLTTIVRVARFLKNEPYQGYIAMLKKVRNKNNVDIKK